jgi:hypothetical protein
VAIFIKKYLIFLIYFALILGIMEIIDAIRALFGGPVDLPQFLLAILVFIALLIAERYYQGNK